MFENLLDVKNCECGKDHSLITREYIVEENALLQMAEILDKLNFKKPLFIFDANTYKATAEKIRACLPQFKELILNGENVHPDEEKIEMVRLALMQGYDVGVAVGAGVICDITRYVTFKLGMPFICAPTAASVDGFVSDSAAVTLKGAKHTLPAQAPVAVIADLRVIANAPKYLAASGVGDMLSKYIAIADWKIGNLYTGEYYCPYVAKLTLEAVDGIVDSVEEIKQGKAEGMRKLMYGLLLSGICMQMTKITRSASSFEHHYSHFLEVIPYNNVKKDALHGEKVGIATLLAVKYYPTFVNLTQKIYKENLPNAFDINKIIDKYAKFGDFTKQMLIDQNLPTVTDNLNIELLKANFDEAVRIARELPTYDKLKQVLTTLGGYTSPAQINLSEEENAEVLSLCCYIRNRFTMLRLVCDYNLFDFFNDLS